MNDIITKTCTKCGENKPATLEFFYKNGEGVHSHCKTCVAVVNKAWIAANPERALATSKAWYGINHERVSVRAKALRVANPERANAASNAWKLANPERVKAKGKAYRAANPERTAAVSKAWSDANRELRTNTNKAWYKANRERVNAIALVWREANRERTAAASRAWLDANRERNDATHKAWRAGNPEKINEARRRRRARKNSAPTEPYTTQQILDIYGADCHICLEPIDIDAPRGTRYSGWELGLHLDHVIPLSKGGTDLIDNIRPAHGLCNVSKGDRTRHRKGITNATV